MDVTKTIATNLSGWMDTHPTLKTVQLVSAKSGVGFGTVRRAKKGEGNVTVQNLELIAKAFGRRPEDLLVADHRTSKVTELTAKEPEPQPPLIAELIGVAKKISERGQIELIGRAKEMALQYPAAAKSKRA